MSYDKFLCLQMFSHCMVHGRRPPDKTKCMLCSVAPQMILRTRKDILMVETPIYDFYTSLCKPSIKQLSIHVPHSHIIGTYHCGNTRSEAFNHSGFSQDVLCCWSYAEILVVGVSQQIQSKYYGGNRSVSIEGIALDQFSDSKQPLPLSAPPLFTHNDVFHSFFLW